MIYYLLYLILGDLEVDDISVDLIERCLYTSLYSYNAVGDSMSSNKQSLPNLLIRTSGEVRLSDFLLWQSSYSVTYFTSVLWPDFGLHHLMAAIFQYQSKKYYISEIFNRVSSIQGNLLTSPRTTELVEAEKKKERICKFLDNLDNSTVFSSWQSQTHSNLSLDIYNSQFETATTYLGDNIAL